MQFVFRKIVDFFVHIHYVYLHQLVPKVRANPVERMQEGAFTNGLFPVEKEVCVYPGDLAQSVAVWTHSLGMVKREKKRRPGERGAYP